MSSDCPIYGELEFDNGNVEPWESFNRLVQEIHPPGFDGTLLKHMGKSKRPFTINGILESVTPGAAPIKKIKDFEAAANTSVKTLKFAGFTFKKVRLIKMNWKGVRAVLRDGKMFLDVEYEAKLEQLSDDTT